MSDSDQDQLANLSAAVNEILLRQKRLEERLENVERSLKAPPPASGPMFGSLAVTPAPAAREPLPEPPPAPVAVAAEEFPPSPALETKVGLTIINRIGAVTLVLGVAFFFKWAVDNNWVGPLGRVALGLFAGFGALAMADFLWRKAQQVFAQGITGTGIAIVYVAFYAAFDFYHLTPQVVAFLLLLATTVLAVALALRYASIAIAALGLFGAYLIPLLLSNGEDHPWFLVAYLLTLNFAASLLAVRRTLASARSAQPDWYRSYLRWLGTRIWFQISGPLASRGRPAGVLCPALPNHVAGLISLDADSDRTRVGDGLKQSRRFPLVLATPRRHGVGFLSLAAIPPACAHRVCRLLVYRLGGPRALFRRLGSHRLPSL